ncbi:hypothetical protein CPB83DRAFT_817090 [Crepidotus variabilis]|uniref:Uncharacterized protein n=1 Tax=Crepidotus variabilis TaxID=179855 RepID=A0A9P6EBP9_9AGAR|nr:hypothetical protein CPB83DRAFT_817090 [Crepidotus variabilis]
MDFQASNSNSTGAAFFGAAQHVHIHESHFNTTVTQPRHENGQPVPDAHRQTQSNSAFIAQQLASSNLTRASNVLYQEQMMHKRRGHPLWFPQVSLNLAAEHRAKGFSIGDVGNFTPDGAFDFLFNILLPADHPINGSEADVPEGFVPLGSFDQRQVREYREFEPGTYLASSSVETSHVDVNGLTFASTASEGAVLTMPDGAHKVDISNTTAFQSYMAENADSWYKFVNGPSRGRNLDNGELRLVYGYDKSTSWGIATFSNVSYPSDFRLKFCKSRNTPDEAAGGSGSAYSWEHSGMADAMRVGPGVDDNEGLEDFIQGNQALRNQCLFLRTMTVTLADGDWQNLNAGVHLHQRVQETSTAPGWGSALSLPGSMAAAAAVGGPFVFMLFKSIGGAGVLSAGAESRADEDPVADDKGLLPRVNFTDVDLAAIPHPSTVINKILLHLHPTARTAITTDAAWQEDLPLDWKFLSIDSFVEKLEIKAKAFSIGDTVYLDPLCLPTSAKYHALICMSAEALSTGTFGFLEDIASVLEPIVERPVGFDPLHSSNLRAPSVFTALGSSSSLALPADGPTDLSKSVEFHQNILAALPAGHPEKPLCLDKLGQFLARRFEGEGDHKDIQSAVDSFREAVLLTSEDHRQLPHRLSRLGAALHHMFKTTGRLSDLSAAIRYKQKAVLLMAADHPDFISHLASLALSFFDRYDLRLDPSDILAAIELQQKAVSFTPEDHPRLPELLDALGDSFSRRFARMRYLDDISTAIKYRQKAVLFTPEGYPNMPMRLTNLGTSFHRRFHYTGDLEDISAAISHETTATKLVPQGHPDLPFFLSNLGDSFYDRYQRTSDLSDITAAIECKENAVTVTSKNHPDLPQRLSALATSFHSRFEQTKDLNDIAAAIENGEKATLLLAEDHPDLPLYLFDLGNAFSSRFKQSGNLSDISAAIEHQEKAVHLTPESHQNMARYLSFLGCSFFNRYHLTGDPNDISSAILCEEKVVELTPDSSPDLHLNLSNLGDSLFKRFGQTSNLSDISNAIKHFQKSVLITPKGHPNLPNLLYILADSLSKRYDLTSDQSDETNSKKYKEQADILSTIEQPRLSV